MDSNLQTLVLHNGADRHLRQCSLQTRQPSVVNINEEIFNVDSIFANDTVSLHMFTRLEVVVVGGETIVRGRVFFLRALQNRRHFTEVCKPKANRRVIVVFQVLRDRSHQVGQNSLDTVGAAGAPQPYDAQACQMCREHDVGLTHGGGEGRGQGVGGRDKRAVVFSILILRLTKS